jgi:hypothetical protein
MEDSEIKTLIREDIRLAEENNRMLHKISKRTRWVFIISIVKWIIVIGATIGLFYFLKPYADSLTSAYQAITGQHIPDFSKYFGK